MSDPGISDLQLERAQDLYRAGKIEDAIVLFREYLRAHPRHFEALHSLGMTYFQTGQFERAQYFLGEALRLDPDFIDGLRVRGAALMQLKRYAAALSSFERALSIKPDHIEALVNRATVLLEMKRTDDALAAFDRLLALDPENAIAWNNRGNVLVAMRRFDEAALCYDRALAIQPGLPTAENNRFLVLLQLRRISRIPDFALREMFDGVASRFDKLMVDQLGYSGHLHVRTLADRVLPRRTQPWRILDLGCGTGLVGEAFKDLAAGGRLDGIDLAPRMIEAARSRGVYDELILDDLETVLAAQGPLYDLIVSADTMIYLGDLGPTFFGAANRLNAGGFYIFACESKTGDGWEQTPANRFRHSENYLREEAARAGLSFVDLMECTLRSESAEPVPGFAVALQKPLPKGNHASD